MMKTYALIQAGVVYEIIPPMIYEDDLYGWVEGEPSRIGTEIPIELRYAPGFVAAMVDITDMSPQPECGWIATPADDSWTLAPYAAPPATPAEVLASQSAKLQGFVQLAAAQKVALTNRIGVLNDAIELEEATQAEAAELPVRQAQLLNWKRYAIYLGRVTSQAGWPPEVEWPVQPAEGMDLTVSAVAPDSLQLQ